MTADPDIVMLARGLTKVFVKNRTPYVAVKDVYFSVRAGECFGLLGVNGAGKSTCFKMLTGDLLPTDGDSSIKNKWLRSNRSSVSNLIIGEFVFCSAYSQCYLFENLSSFQMVLSVIHNHEEKFVKLLRFYF